MISFKGWFVDLPMIKIGTWISLLFILTGCATLPPPAENHPIAWEQRTKILSQFQTWKLQGAIGIRTAEDSLSASLTWEQHAQNYTLSLFGPLGANSFILTGQPNHVELAMSDGRKFIARNPETLLAEQLRWQLPVSNLYYWIRGLPVPTLAAQKQFDTSNRLIELKQQGWQIQFLRYTSLNGMDVPTKIFLNYPQLHVKIVITQWQI